MAVLYRGMMDDGEGQPVCGPSARKLGVRLEGDIRIPDDGMVEPGTGGMSVGLDDPMNVRPHRRPPEFGGFGRDPRERMADALEWASDVLPLTYAYDALARATADDLGARLAADVAVVSGAIALALVLGATTLRRRTA
jgi:hypothetical protein